MCSHSYQPSLYLHPTLLQHTQSSEAGKKSTVPTLQHLSNSFSTICSWRGPSFPPVKVKSRSTRVPVFAVGLSHPLVPPSSSLLPSHLRSASSKVVSSRISTRHYCFFLKSPLAGDGAAFQYRAVGDDVGQLASSCSRSESEQYELQRQRRHFQWR